MSSIIDNSYLQSVYETVNPYVNEVVAIALFGVGYFLFRTMQHKNKFQKAKLTNILKTPSATQNQDPQTILYQYNIYIRDNLSHKPNLNPFEILHQMQLEGITADITSYNTLLDICLEQRLYEISQKLFNQMKDSMSPIKPDVITYNTLIKGLSIKLDENFGLKKDEEQKDLINQIFKEISEVMAEMQEQNLQANVITYNTVIDACVKSNEMRRAFDFYDEMSAKNLKPDVYTYSTLVKGIKNPECLNPSNNLARIFKIMENLKTTKVVKIDEILYNCVIDACFKFGDYSKAVKLLNEMIDSNVKPSAITYGIMIKGYGQYKFLDNALAIYQKMEQENLQVNEITLGCLIDACVKCNNLQKGCEILQKNQSKANTIIYTTILKGYTKEKNLSKAMEIFEMMKKNPQTKPNLVTLNSLLDCAVQSSQFEKMELIYKQITSSSSAIAECAPDLITYSTYIKGLCKNKKGEEAYELYKKMKKDNVFQFDEVLFNSLLDGLVKIRLNEKAFEVYEHMKEVGIKASNVTYSILIKLFNNLQKIEEAFKIHQQMKNENIKPGLIVYTCLIQSCVKNKKIEKIIDLYDEMIKNGVYGDGVFYNTLISGLVYNQQLKKGVEILMGTLERNVRLADEVYNNVLRNLCKIMERKHEKSVQETSFSKEQAEIHLLKMTMLMKKNKFFIEMELYNQIASYLYKDGSKPQQQSQNYQQNRQFNGQYNNSSSNGGYQKSQNGYQNNNQNSHYNKQNSEKKIIQQQLQQKQSRKQIVGK